MPKGPRIENDVLLTAGLELMRQNGKPLRKVQSPGRSMLYALPNGESVRVRTCNDHILIVLADRPTEGAGLNIEGTDWLLVVMPEIERTPGKVIAYLVPTKVAVEAVRRTHQEWLDTNPNTRGSNTTWNLWFDRDGPAKANDFATEWIEYRLNGEATHPGGLGETSEPNNIKAEVEAARLRISRAAGVSPAAVRITVDFGA
ncbi:MAG TPA: hypothetical protein VI685_08840 [Candidatus Angelobacter sp.]